MNSASSKKVLVCSEYSGADSIGAWGSSGSVGAVVGSVGTDVASVDGTVGSVMGTVAGTVIGLLAGFLVKRLEKWNF